MVPTDLFKSAMAVGMVGETLLFVLTGLVVFIRWRYTLAEAISYAIITTLMVLSLILQLGLILQLPWLTYGMEVLLVAAALATMVKARATAGWVVKNFVAFFRGSPYLAGFVSVAWGCLLIQAVVLPPAGGHWRALNDALMLHRMHSGDLLSSGSLSYGPVGAMNAAILPFSMLRFQTDMGCGVFGFLAYLAIASMTYTLSRRYSWPPTALTVSVIVISMPRLVYHAVSPGAEIVPAATALFCILALFRALENPNIGDLLLLVVGIFFLICGGAMCLALPLIMLGLGCVKLVRRHGVITWWTLLKSHRRVALAAIIPMAVFSQAWLFVWNYRHTGKWVGDPYWGGFAYNQDGIYGSLANLVRYVFESADFLMPFDWLSQRVLGFSPPQMLENLANVLISPVFGDRGAEAPFRIYWMPDASLSWFGPLAFLMIFAALGFAMVRGPRRLKITGVALSVYFYLVILIPAWQPGNAHYFTSFYVCGGFCVAFLLPPWRFTIFQKKALQFLAALMIGYALWVNTVRPAVAFNAADEARHQRDVTVFNASSEDPWINFRRGWPLNRFGEARRLFGDNRVEKISDLLPAHARIGLQVPDSGWSYPLLLANPEVSFVFLQPEEAHGEKLETLALDYFLFLSLNSSAGLAGPAGVTVWVSEPDARIKGYLMKMTAPAKG